jgi:hypothetical protein
VYINAAFPHIFGIDFRESATGISRMNTQDDTDEIYTFVVEANYTIGGVDSWTDADINITAWYDEGLTGITGACPPATYGDTNRTRQFSMVYDANAGTTAWAFPAGVPNEFSWVDTNLWGPYGPDFHYFLYINVSFEIQTWAADGNGFASGGATGGNIWDINSGLNDPSSWDFMVNVYDRVNTGAADQAFEEFGMNKAVSIAVAGNPTGNAPPGTNGVALGPTSQVTYSANCNYTVNVSIPDLYLNGIVGPDVIAATNLYIRNAESADLVNQYTSEISNQVYFTGPGADWLVWGNRSNPGAPGALDELNPPYNGTNANGPFGSNFNTYVGPTDISWWANIPAGIPEGTYWAVITFTIWNP